MPDEAPGTPSSTPATPAAAAVAAPPAVPAAQPTPAQPGPIAPGVPPTVTITNTLYETLVAQQAENVRLQADQRQRDERARQDRVRLLVEQGKTEEAMKANRDDADRRVAAEQEQRIATERRAARYAVDNDLTPRLSGIPLCPGAAEQLTHLFRGNFIATPEGEGFAVRTAGGQSASDFIAATLALPHYAHFRPATNLGGTGGAAGGSISPPTPAANPTTPDKAKNLGEAVIMLYQQRDAAKPTDGRTDMSAPMGLRRTAVK